MTAVAIVVRVGRPTARRVVSELADSLSRYGHFGSGVDFRLYLSVDSEKSDVISPDLILDSPLTQRFAAIRLLLYKEHKEMADRLAQLVGVSNQVAETIALRQPYSCQLNSALMWALAEDNDAALFFDDDVSFSVPVATANKDIAWRTMDVIGLHLRALRGGALVSTGRVVGFLSPIPPALTAHLSETTVQDLGSVFEDAHEFLTSESFGTPVWQVLTEAEAMDEEVRSAQAPRGYRWITPANLGIDLRGDFPVFFNPPGSRGEDAFFVMALRPWDTVSSVPGAVFHDPFLLLPDVHHTVVLKNLSSPALSTASIDRFVSAVFGWVAYIPLFLRIVRGTEGASLSTVLRAKERLIHRASEALNKDLEVSAFMRLPDHFRQYCDRVEHDYGAWREANAVWRTIVRPYLAGSNQMSLRSGV